MGTIVDPLHSANDLRGSETSLLGGELGEPVLLLLAQGVKARRGGVGGRASLSLREDKEWKREKE